VPSASAQAVSFEYEKGFGGSPEYQEILFSHFRYLASAMSVNSPPNERS
jgi:hypothetical protein